MGTLTLAGSASGAVTLTPAPVAGATTLTLPSTTGTVLAGNTPTSSVNNTVTNKIAVEINGVTYYLLASTSAA